MRQQQKREAGDVYVCTVVYSLLCVVIIKFRSRWQAPPIVVIQSSKEDFTFLLLN